MQLKTSIIVEQHADAISEEATSTYPTDVILDVQVNMQMIQNVLLIWLDENIDENNEDCRNTIRKLRHIAININKFTDPDLCIQFLQNIGNEKVYMIISDLLGQHIIHRIHEMSQIDSIFIFCNNKEYDEQWTTEWSKIKGVFTDIVSVCETLQKAVQECEYNAMSISIMAIEDGSEKNLDQLEPSFMYIQIIKEILLEIQFEPNHLKQYIDYCRQLFAKNDRQLQNIKKLERQYRDKTPIWWYTRESFLYPMVNRGLRLMDVDIIIRVGFFIKDLHQHIEQLYNEQFIVPQCTTQFTVYRGQPMEKTEFEHLTKTKGGLISFNNFLSTSKNHSTALQFLRRGLTSSDLMGVLFVMNIDPSQSTTPFASIKDVSAVRSEDEVLFAMQTVFRIGDITSVDENARLFQVELTLTSDNDKDLQQLTDYIQKKTLPNSRGWYRLATMLLNMGHFNKAEEVYRVLLKQVTNENEKAPIYNQLGAVKDNQGKYKEAITFYEKALEIDNKTLPPNHPDLAMSYSNIGIVYKNIGEYSKALSYYEKSLQIRQQSLPSNHLDLADSYINIAGLYYDQNEYSEALSYSEKALEIQQETLPPNHPELAGSYNNIAGIYYTMGDYVRALSYSEKSFKIQQATLPSNHPALAASYNNIGTLYEIVGEYSKALSFYEHAVNIGQLSLPPNHPELQKWRDHFETMKNKLQSCCE